MTQTLFDRRRQFQIQKTALHRYGRQASFLYDRVVDDLLDRLTYITRTFETAAILSDPTGRCADHLRQQARNGPLVQTVWSTAWSSVRQAGFGPSDVVADDELIPFAADSLNLVISPLALHWANDLPGTFRQIHRTLQPDGLLIGALLGGETLTELRDVLTSAELEVRDGAALRVIPSVNVQIIGGLLQRAGFALPVVDQDHLTVRYDSLIDLIRDIRAMGGTPAFTQNDTPLLTRRILERADTLYREKYQDPDGRLRATFQVIYFSGWSPHHSQQKPLAPGSARHSLKDAVQALDMDRSPDPDEGHDDMGS